MDSERERLAAAIVLFCGYKLLMKKKKPRQRRWWMCGVNNTSRKRLSVSNDVIADLVKEPSGELQNFCCLSREDFQYLLDSIGPRIQKEDTKFRKAIPAVKRLAITLRFLATGDSFKSLHDLFNVSSQIISEIVPEVCSALIDLLMDQIKLPKSSDEWKSVAESFNKAWNFPHCVGALDGRHITMESPINIGSEYSSHKQSLSIVLITLVDAQHCFTFVDCGCQGRVGDGGVYQHSKLYQKIVRNELHTPSPEPLPGRTKPVPYVIVADDAFEFSPILMKPYQEKHDMSTKERVFNYRLLRARRVAENTFGILASVFRVLRKPMLLQPEKVTLITMTCVLLHNFLRRSRTSRSIYTPPGTFDREENGDIVPGMWRQDRASTSSLLPIARLPSKPKTVAETIRIEFSDYFVSHGKVPGQDRYS